MPKRTILLIIFLTAAAIGLIVFSYYSKQEPKPPAVTPPKETSVSNAHTVLSLTALPVPIANTSPKQYSVEVNIDSGENLVSGVQLEFSYDPKLLANVDISEGPFLKGPVELLKNIDAKNGRISYALGIPMGQTGITGKGVVAKITFTEISGSSKTASINFLPKTQVTDQRYAVPVLKSTTSTTFNIEASLPVNSSTASGQ